MSAKPLPASLQAATESRRMEILGLIWDEERTVSEIAEKLPVSMPAVSQHLSKLKRAELVTFRAEGRKRYYRARKENLGALGGALATLWSDRTTPPPAKPASPAPTPAPREPLVSKYGLPPLPPPPPRPPAPEDTGSPTHAGLPDGPDDATPGKSASLAVPPRPVSPRADDLDEMASWYRQGLRARVVALEAARSMIGTDDAADRSVRRIARSLTRPAIAHRFSVIGATASKVADQEADITSEGVDRLIGAIRQAAVHDDSTIVKILIVEDSRVEAMLHRSIIRGPNREILTADTAEDAQRILASEEIDLVLLDLTLPGADGRDLLIDMGRRPRTANIPVILLTGRTDAQTRTEAMSLGADAYYTKPVDPPVLATAVSMMLERAAEARDLGRRDPLTGLRNRAVFLQDVRQLAATAVRAKVPLSLAILDLDRLAAINDFHGSESGDDVVRMLAHTLRDTFRRSDMIARWGGGKFAILFSNAGTEGAAIALDKLRTVTNARSVQLDDGTDLVATWHAGVASIRTADGVDDAVARATRRLQIAGRGKGDRVVSVDAAVFEGVRTVLLIEDDEILGDLIRHRLSREGFQVERFSDGAEALGALAEINASAVVLDTMLPGAEGFEVLRRLKESPSYAGVPVIVLTFGSEHDTARAFKLGASDSLAKPFSVEELVARVARLVAESEGIGA